MGDAGTLPPVPGCALAEDPTVTPLCPRCSSADIGGLGRTDASVWVVCRRCDHPFRIVDRRRATIEAHPPPGMPERRSAVD